MLSIHRPLPCFPTETLLCIPVSTQWHGLIKFRIYAPIFVKILQYSAVLVFPVNGFEEGVLMCNSLCVTFSLFLSVSLTVSSLQGQGPFPSTAPAIIFFPEWCLCPSYLPRCGFFPLSLVLQFFLSPFRLISWVFEMFWYLSIYVLRMRQV